MTDPEITRFPSSILRKKATKIAKVGDSEREMLSMMAKAMYLNQGVGLAAVQVGIDKQLAVVDVGDGLIKLINPAILKREGSEIQEEGCLSVPGARVKVKRAKKIVVSFLNENGEIKQVKAENLLARAIQHELDHLSGTLIIDYLNPIKKIFLRKKFSSIKK